MPEAAAGPVPAHVPPERVLRFDFRNDPEIASDPWAYLAKMNDLPDIFFSPDLGGYWVITRYDMIGEVFSNHELFTAKSLAIPKIENPMILIPNNFDPPEHTAYRRIFAQGLFSPRATTPGATPASCSMSFPLGIASSCTITPTSSRSTCSSR